MAFARKSFARAGRPDHQNALGNPSAEALKFFRIFQKLHKF